MCCHGLFGGMEYTEEQKQPTCGPDYCEIGGHNEQT